MRRHSVFALVLSLALLSWACGRDPDPLARGGASSPAATATDAGLDPGSLPASLDALFPPRADKPVFLLAMVELGGALDGLVADLMQGDVPGARSGMTRLRAAYEACARLVPEWAERFPSKPLDDLETVLAGEDPGTVMGAVQELGGICHRCHHVAMVAVQQRYEWGDFQALEVTDPLTEEDVPYTALMHHLAANLAGITTDLAQGQVDAARRHLQELRARYTTLEETCGSCHRSERRYFVGEDVASTFTSLATELAKAEPDAAAAGRLTGVLGEKSCHRCHLVHLPAAYAKAPD